MKFIRLCAGVLTGAMLLALCACSNPEAEDNAYYATASTNREVLSGAEADTQQTPVQDFAVSWLPEEGVNPFTCKSTSNRTLFTFLYDSLFTITSDFIPEPVLCDTFSVSDDLQTYRFTLVSGVKFSDGTALRAEDVAASLRAAKDSEFYAGRLAHVSGVQAVDDATVEVTLDTPLENLPLVLDVPIVKSDTTQQDVPTGTGAYAVSGQTLQRCTDDWHPNAPAVDVASISLVAATSPNEIRDAFEFGDTDLVCTDPNAAGSSGYHCNYGVWDCSTTVMQYIGFNRIAGLCANDTLRAAITYAIDRAQLINQELDGYAEPASLPCSPCSPYYDAELAQTYDYDPEKFSAALLSSGQEYSQENPGTFLVCSTDSERVNAAQNIASALRTLGFFVNVRSLDYESYQDALKNGNYDMYYGEVKLPANFDLSCFFTLEGSLNYGGIADAGTLQLCMDALKNSGGYQALFTDVMDKASICPVLFKNYAVYMSRNTVDYIAPAIDNVLYVSGGRTLSDANKAYDSQQPPDDTGDTGE